MNDPRYVYATAQKAGVTLPDIPAWLFAFDPGEEWTNLSLPTELCRYPDGSPWDIQAGFRIRKKRSDLLGPWEADPKKPTIATQERSHEEQIIDLLEDIRGFLQAILVRLPGTGETTQAPK